MSLCLFARPISTPFLFIFSGGGALVGRARLPRLYPPTQRLPILVLLGFRVNQICSRDGCSGAALRSVAGAMCLDRGKFAIPFPVEWPKRCGA